MDLNALRAFVEREIETYAPEWHEDLVGRPIPDEVIAVDLQRMRQALVQPYWVSAVPFEPKDATDVQRFAVVTDDRDGYLLAFDPTTDAFVLLFKNDQGALHASHLDGDAVGCFLAQ